MMDVLDGGCGLELKRRKSLGQRVAYDLVLFSTAALRDTPDAVEELHRDYIRAGCTVLTTASYAVTEFYLARVGESFRVPELAARSVSLAKAARAAEGADGAVLVAGSVPPLGESYHAADLPPAELRRQYTELVAGLAGCDLYLCETMPTVAEGRLAAELCRSVSDRVWLSFHPRRRGDRACVSADGSTVEAAVEAAVEVGAEAVLFNCATPEIVELAVADAVSAARGRLRVGGYANFWEELDDIEGWTMDKNETSSGAGDRKRGGMVVRRDLTPRAYANAAIQWRRLGASIIGGCCGICPDTMATVARELA